MQKKQIEAMQAGSGGGSGAMLEVSLRLKPMESIHKGSEQSVEEVESIKNFLDLFV